MSLIKRMMEEMEARGWDSVPDKLVCSSCLSDDTLKEFVVRDTHGDWNRCDYCGRETSGEGIAIPLEDLMAPIAAAVYYYFEELDAEYWNSELGDYVVGKHDARDVLWDLGWPFAREDLAEDVVDAFADRLFCERDPFSLKRHEALLYGWESFVQHVLHKSRYVFLTAATEEDEWEPEAIPPGRMLDEIGSIIEQIESVTPIIPAGSRFTRALPHEEEEIDLTARRLGAPPINKTRSTRMSPAGITVFYAATDVDTALAEIAAHLGRDSDARFATSAEFILARDIRVLDLTKLPSIPSPFDERAAASNAAIRFLHHFAREVSKPVERSDREIVDYVPTQIVTDYFINAYHLEERRHRLRGIVYQSAAHPEGKSIVLFFDNDACVELEEDWESKGQDWLALDASSPRTHRLIWRPEWL